MAGRSTRSLAITVETSDFVARMSQSWDHHLEHGEFVADSSTEHLATVAKSNPREAIRLIDAVAARPEAAATYTFLADCIVHSLETNWDVAFFELQSRMASNVLLAEVARNVRVSDIPEAHRLTWALVMKEL